MRCRILMPCLFFLILSFGLLYASSAYSGHIAIMDVKGDIGPAISDFIQHDLATLVESNDILVNIRIDTPGGLDLSMGDIIQEIFRSSIPVVTYVALDGPRLSMLKVNFRSQKRYLQRQVLFLRILRLYNFVIYRPLVKFQPIKAQLPLCFPFLQK